jgi:hypothetical protein
MLKRIVFSLALCAAVPGWSQVSTTYGGVGLTTTDQMQTPPPVSGQAYPSAVGAETHSNFLRASFNLTTGFSDNVLGYNVYPVNDVFWTMYSNLSIDKSTARMHLTLNYNPGFTVYKHTSSYNQLTQDLGVNFLYRLSAHVTFTAQDGLLKSSSVLSQPYLVSGGPVSGSAPPLIDSISPVADVLGNVASVQLRDQFRRDGMVGVEGSFGNQNYLNKKEAQGLYDSSSRGGSGFYNYRLSKKQYMGATYRYSKILVYPNDALSEITTNSVSLFYTFYVTPSISVSFTGGPQHFAVSQAPLPVYSSWQPTFAAGVGWQVRHTNIVGSYSRIVSGGGGLLGAFESTSATVSARRQLGRTWSTGLALSYLDNVNVTPAYLLSTEQGGHSATGAVTFQHEVSEHFVMSFGYTRWQQKYSSIQVISSTPSTDRVFFTIAYQLRRPLGD